MNYQFKTSRDRKNKKTFQKASAGTFLALVLIAFLVWAPHSSSAAVEFFGVPIWKAENYLLTPFVFVENMFTSKEKLLSENQALTNELSAESQELADQNALAGENQALKSMLGRSDNESLILAAVLERPNQTPYDTLIIDGGAAVGMKIGSEVLSEDSILIGSISDVYANSARVTLFSTPGVKAQVLVGDAHTAATAEGQGGGNFTIKLPRSIPVKEGDLVIAPDLHIKIFGTIQHIDLTPSDSFQTLYFSSLVNPNQLRFVSVVKQ